MLKTKRIHWIFVAFLFLSSCIRIPIEEKRNDSQTYIEEEKYSPKVQSDVFIIYSTPKRVDNLNVPETGEIVGHDYHFTFDGQIIDFTNYYNLGSKITNIYSTDENTINNLDSLFKKYDFMNFPSRISGTNKQKGHPKHFTFGYRPSPNAKFKFVNAQTNQVERRHYPEGFFDLVSALKKAIGN